MNAIFNRWGWLMCVLLLWFTRAECTEAHTQLPIPHQVIGTQPEVNQVDPITNETTEEFRGSTRTPLVVKIVPDPESKEEADHRNYERHVKPSLDRGLTYGTYVLAGATCLLFFFTALLWWVTYQLSQAAKKDNARQAALTRESIDLSRRQFAASRRPWLAVNVRLASGTDWRDGGMTVTVSFFMRNVGATPALNVWVDPQIYIQDMRKPDPTIEQQKASQQRIDNPLSWGRALFPTEEAVLHYTLNMGKQEFDEARIFAAKSVGVVPNSLELPVSFRLLGCVTYRSIESADWHQTGFIYDLHWQRPDTGFKSPFFPERGNVPQDQLLLEKTFTGSGITT